MDSILLKSKVKKQIRKKNKRNTRGKELGFKLTKVRDQTYQNQNFPFLTDKHIEVHKLLENKQTNKIQNNKNPENPRYPENFFLQG